MPKESNRTTKNKRVKLPSGTEVLVPVITSISFIDPVRQYQEYEYSVDNSAKGDRDIHVDDVKSLQVERIEKWKVLDPQRQYQESDFAFDNVTGAHDDPIHFSTHTKTHKVKWGDSNAWVESELIDEFSVIDPIQQYQEHSFTLTGNPDVDANGFAITQADPSDPDITDSDNGVDPPWRTDPFQNIVDFSSAYYVAIITFNSGGGYDLFHYVNLADQTGGTNDNPITYLQVVLNGVGLVTTSGDATKPNTAWHSDPDLSKLNFSSLRGAYPQQPLSFPVTNNGMTFTFHTAPYSGPPWQVADQGGGVKVHMGLWTWTPVGPSSVPAIRQSWVPFTGGPAGTTVSFSLVGGADVAIVFPELGVTGSNEVLDDAGHPILGPFAKDGANMPFIEATSITQEIYAVISSSSSVANLHWGLMNSEEFDFSGLSITLPGGQQLVPVGVQTNHLAELDPGTFGGGMFDGLDGIGPGGTQVAVLFKQVTHT
jgi:hypothetical protein